MADMTLHVEGMMCGMCEAHVCDAIRKAFPEVSKVKASHAKGTVWLTASRPLPVHELHHALDPTGYKLLDATIDQEASGGESGKGKGFLGKLFSGK